MWQSGFHDAGGRPRLATGRPNDAAGVYPGVWYAHRGARVQGAVRPPNDATVYLALVDALFLFIIASAFITPWDGGDEGWTPWAVAGIGVACVLAVEWTRTRPLSTASPSALAGTYRTKMFLGIGFAEAAGLFGIVGIFLSGSLWVYLVGLAFGLFAFWRNAPSRLNLARDQERLREQGSPLNLIAALNAPPISGPK